MIPVGIDLGTTNSAVARLDRHGRPVVVPNRHGEATTPSVLCFTEGGVLAGREAKELQAAGHPGAVAFFKRQMGDPHWIFPAGGRDYRAADLSSLLLAALKTDAEAALGETLDQAVITVPAYFREPQRRATLAAAQGAGLEVLQLINEPTAAAVAYGLGPGRSGARTLLVYDLGGGTFDVTLMRLEAGELHILTSDGDHELGGKDWDDRVVEYLGGRFAAEHGSDPLSDAESLSDLLVRAEEAKRRLSTAATADLSIVHDGVRERYTLQRETFEEITADLLDRTFTLAAGVLEGLGLTPDRVDGVLLVGGSTRMPAVRRQVRETFGREPTGGVDPDEAVALGAAVTAAGRDADRGGEGTRRFTLAGAVKTVDVTNHSLGVIAVNEDRSAYVNSHILTKDTPVPCRDSRAFKHQVGSRGGTLEIFLTQGEEVNPADVLYLGLHAVQNVPPSPSGETVVEVEYAYDAGGVVNVEARDAASGCALAVEVQPLPPDVPARFLEPPPVPPKPKRLTAYLAFDLSGSMAGEPLEAAKRAACGFVDNLVPERGDVGVIAFADSVRVALKACGDPARIRRAISDLTVGEVGIGNRADPFEEVRALLRRADAPRFVVTLADGVWADQPRAVLRAEACHGEGIESIAIGFGGADEAFLRQIASSDEAGIFTSLERLEDTFSTIAQVIGEGVGEADDEPSRGWRGSLAGLLKG